MKEICETLSEEVGKELFSLWSEYEENETLEAKFAKDLDKCEMIFQANEYERDQKVDLTEFYDSKGKIVNAEVLGWLEGVNPLKKLG